MSKWANILLKNHLASLNMQWHDGSSNETLIYLGFPVLFGSDQTTVFWNKVLAKIRAGIALHSSRSLSVLGRATIVNALILSRLWHLACVMSFPTWFLTKVRTAFTGFLCPFKPAASWKVIATPRHQGGLGVIDPGIQHQVFLLKHLRNAASDSISWGKDVVLDLILWKTKASHRLAFLLAPQDGQYSARLAGFPFLQKLAVTASRLPSLRTSITQAGLPDSSTFLATPLDWWFPATNNTSTPLLSRIGDLFSLETNNQGKYRVNHRPKLPAKLQHAREDLFIQLSHTKSRRMSQTYLMAVQSPPVGTSGDLLATRILSIVLLISGKTIVTFSTATTKHLRQFLPPSPDPEPPPPTSSFCPEIGSKSSWRRFWRAKIPHRARTFWWRYKQDILPCGTLRARRWGQDPKCDRDGCTEPKADKQHYVFLCDSKFWAWQFILEKYTDKPLWSDNVLRSLLSFTPPKFCINPRYNISLLNSWRAAFWVFKQLTTFSSTTNSLSPGTTFPTISCRKLLLSSLRTTTSPHPNSLPSKFNSETILSSTI